MARTQIDYVIESLKRGEIRQVKIFDSSIACLKPCYGYHKKYYIEHKNNKFYIVREGEHHALPLTWKGEKEITEEEARELIEIAIKTDSLVIYR
jgi:hypothetical protein